MRGIKPKGVMNEISQADTSRGRRGKVDQNAERRGERRRKKKGGEEEKGERGLVQEQWRWGLVWG